MFRIDKGKVKVIINLDNGVYYFDEESATGKTRLAKVFRGYTQDYPVASYSYDDLALKIPFDTLVKPGEQKVLVIDRYDIYKGTLTEQIKEFAKTGIVLIDCKGNPGVKCNLCFIEMTADTIEVHE